MWKETTVESVFIVKKTTERGSPELLNLLENSPEFVSCRSEFASCISEESKSICCWVTGVRCCSSLDRRTCSSGEEQATGASCRNR
ncbi:hypothetical protein LIER_04082 [Lithospermum erythrorhizon]|uniref:Uncharacterized protein n=1 Tax=Lithospermum erythrorhizon TaxID=34254 RepID=A0AAV3NW75_LITER